MAANPVLTRGFEAYSQTAHQSENLLVSTHLGRAKNKLLCLLGVIFDWLPSGKILFCASYACPGGDMNPREVQGWGRPPHGERPGTSPSRGRA